MNSHANNTMHIAGFLAPTVIERTTVIQVHTGDSNGHPAHKMCNVRIMISL